MTRSIKQTSVFLLLSMLLTLLLPASEAKAVDIPFANEHTLDGGFDYAASVFAADMDGDGDLDVIGAARDADEVVWWENRDAEGISWRNHTVDNTFDGARSVVAADIDNDGDLDVIGAAEYDDDITWWENQTGGGQNWSEHTVDPDFDGAHSVAVADIDGDGHLDIVAAGIDAHDIAWWRNSNQGTEWQKLPVDEEFGGAVSVYPADMDGDGDVDLVGAALSDNEVTWWENQNGNGTSWEQHFIDSFATARAVYAADMDGDGDLDVLAVGSDNVDWWENQNGNANSWQNHTVDSDFNGVTAVVAWDIDRDGDQDVIASGGSHISWWENGQSWQKHTVDDSFDGAEFVYVADINGDGRLDLLGAARDDDDITWWQNQSIHRNTTYAVEHEMTQGFDYAASVYAADIDGDGHMDIIAAARDDNDITWWQNENGDGSSWDEDTVQDDFGGAHAVVAADMDQDGDLDLIGAAQSDDDIAWWENKNGDGQQWEKHTVDDNFDGAHSVVATDIDGDGNLDILAAAFSGDQIAWWENLDGQAESWFKREVDNDFPNTPSVYATDIDGDGDMDIVAAGDNTIAWWENTDRLGILWSKSTIDEQFDGARSVYAADMDGDHDADIVGAAATGDKVVWWENENGNGSNWDEHTIDADINAPTSVYAIDIDQDGDLDTLASARTADQIIWWENLNGNGDSWGEHLVDGNVDGAESAYATDLDSDGDIDIIAAASDGNTITWWENRGGQFTLRTTNSATGIINAGTRDDMLKIVATHHGRNGDHDAELATLNLLFEQSAGTPLSDTQANALIESLYIYLDNGSNAFEAKNDLLITTIDTLALSSGVQTVSFADGDNNLRIESDSPRTYFVVVQLTNNADSQTPNTFRLTHQSQSSTVEDRDFDIPLTLHNPTNVSAYLYTEAVYLPAIAR